MSNVPLVDLAKQHELIKDEVTLGFTRVIEASSFILGPQVEHFERQYADYCGVGHAVGVGNGTDAIELALRAVDVGPGDEVITAANTFVATAEAIVRTGATLVLADCDDSFLLDPKALESVLTERTRVVIPVHLYGQMASLDAIREVVGPDVIIIEDAAQSQGASQDGKRSGAVGTAAATSFYPGKNLGGYGDSGAVTTNSDLVAERVRALRNHGGIRRYEHLEVGVNSRMDALQAVVLTAKLRHLDAWNDERRAAAAAYHDMLADAEDVIVPRVLPGNEHVWHLYVVRVPRRERVIDALWAAGVDAGIHYPLPVHRLPAFERYFADAASFPVAERMCSEILSLPIYPGITSTQQERVVAALREAL